MKTFKTTLKFAAIVAATATLVACGGGGGGGSSISAPAPIQTQPAPAPAPDPRFVESSTRVIVAPSATLASEAPDVAKAHSEGWTGQGTNILHSASIRNSITDFAPSADRVPVVGHQVAFSFYNAQGVVDSSLGGVVTTTQQSANFNSNITAAVNALVIPAGAYISPTTTVSADIVGIAVRGNTVSAGNARVVVGITKVAGQTIAGTPYPGYNILNFKATPGTPQYEATFSSIANAPSVEMTEQYKRSAYLLASASIIQSKFAAMDSVDVVKVMDQNRAVGGAFSLSNSLAAKAIR